MDANTIEQMLVAAGMMFGGVIMAIVFVGIIMAMW